MVLCTNGRQTNTHDLDHAFRPHSNVVYLTGCVQPDALLLLRRRRPLQLITRDFETAIKSIRSAKVAISYDSNTFRPEREGSHAAVAPFLGDGHSASAWIDCSSHIFDHRVVKSDSEIRAIRTACRATARAMALCRAVSKMTPRVSEQELAAWVRVELARQGVDCCAFPPIVAVDGNGREWHHEPTHARVAASSRILVDIGAQHRYYAADMTRTWCTGNDYDGENNSFAWMLDAVKAAHAVALTLCKPGNSQRLVHGAAQDVLRKECARHGVFGSDAQCPHAVSHWVGLDLHDVGDPTRTFEPNMTLAIEPALYIGAVAVRWEDTVRIMPIGECEVLTQ